MTDLTRLSFSIEKPLLARLEKLIRSSKYANRSEFIRDMITIIMYRFTVEAIFKFPVILKLHIVNFAKILIYLSFIGNDTLNFQVSVKVYSNKLTIQIHHVTSKEVS